MNWTEKYRPRTLNEVEGQRDALVLLKKLVAKNEVVLVYGPTGSGKTSSVYALANDLDLEVIELNASDFRNREQIESIIGNALKQYSLVAKGKIILIDEIDGLSGHGDRGGIGALAALLYDAKFPIVLVTIDPWDDKLGPLRKKSELVEFKQLDKDKIFNVLQMICSKEGIKYSDENLKILARRSGDLRAAINDLQTATQNKKELNRIDIDSLGEREREETVFNALKILLKSTSPEQVLGIFDNVNIDLDEALLWLDENMPLEYTGEDLVKAYYALSRSDVFNGRIRRKQHWRFLVYREALMTAGVAAAKQENFNGAVIYKRYQRKLK
ncbi:replication factor C large subunit, partial [Candidatus Woesearchaeota archaeon]|nr:replication factor C large subunit [Candidatus Woesearchaeota archaeon]